MNEQDDKMLILGCMLMGKPDWGITEEESHRILDKGLEHNLFYLDTANFYAGGNSEKIIGKWLRSRQIDHLKIMTKVGGPDPEDGTIRGLKASSMVRSVEMSLMRLQIERLFAITLHWPDSSVELEETLEGIQLLFERKLIQHWSLSNYYVGELVRICEKAKQIDLPLPRYHHLNINLLNQGALHEIIPESRYYGIQVLAWSPLCGGLLIDNFDMQFAERFHNPNSFWKRYQTSEFMDKRTILQAIAHENQITLETLALAWLRDLDIIPIVGVEKACQVSQLFNQSPQRLSESTFRQITESIPLLTPYDVIAFSQAQPRFKIPC